MVKERPATGGAGRIAVLGLALVFSPSQSAAFSSKELLRFLGFGGDDHSKINMSIANNIGAGNPDIEKFGIQIIDGGSNEGISGLGSHTSTNGGITYWYNNDALWERDAREKYVVGKFRDAYTRAGFVAHLVEDFQVPAHQKVVFHGVETTYVLSPDRGR